MRIAVIGSGISGLTAAWILAKEHEVTLLESDSRFGGHTRTIDVTVGGVRAAIDTGFLVFNHRTYPHFTALLSHLGVKTAASDMSFSVSLRNQGLEWAGSSLATVFAQKKNLVKPKFWSMLSDILRFNRCAQKIAQTPQVAGDETLGEFLTREKFGRPLRDWYLLPMAGAIWSCSPGAMLAYPIAQFAQFCANHGLLQITNRPQWYTVRGGARNYVERLCRDISQKRLNDPIKHCAFSRRPARLSAKYLAAFAISTIKLLFIPTLPSYPNARRYGRRGTISTLASPMRAAPSA
jgi:uncharacterized protein